MNFSLRSCSFVKEWTDLLVHFARYSHSNYTDKAAGMAIDDLGNQLSADKN